MNIPTLDSLEDKKKLSWLYTTITMKSIIVVCNTLDKYILLNREYNGIIRVQFAVCFCGSVVLRVRGLLHG